MLALVLERDDNEADENVHHEERDDNDVNEIEHGNHGAIIVLRAHVFRVRVDRYVQQPNHAESIIKPARYLSLSSLSISMCGALLHTDTPIQ